MEQPINAFPGYRYYWDTDRKKIINVYRDVELGKGGWVYSEPGVYTNIALLDVASLHPTSIVMLNKLGKYTQRYADLRKARVLIKHGEFEEAGKLFDGALKKYLTNKDVANQLSAALKLPLNAFYGESFATFENPARDSRDKNNIVAMRGALFMKTLFDEVVGQGYRIIHVKTDSIKIANANIDIVKFVQDFAKKYGYEMEHEATYDRICLIDKAQYVAAYMEPSECEKIYGYVPSDNAKQFKKYDYPWTTTGDAFQHPYIFKTLFSGEPVEFRDMCETKEVKKGAIYLDMNESLPDVSLYEKELKRRKHNREKPDDDPEKLNPELADYDDVMLEEKISEGHCYEFIGRVGSFFPVSKGSGGGKCVVFRNGKYDSVSGTSGYRWLEAERVKQLGLQDRPDHGYFDKLIDDAIANTNKVGDFDRFIDLSRPYEDDKPEEEPPVSPTSTDSVVPCGDGKYNSCYECPSFSEGKCKSGYNLEDYALPF